MNIDQIIQMDQQYFMDVYGKRIPICFEHGAGCLLYDTTGKEYVDFFAGIAVNALGYNYKPFVDAMTAQLGKITHCSNYYYNEPQATLAKLLVENTCFDKAFFSNSGAEANEGAIKLARKYFYNKNEAKYEILTAHHSFHGRTMATLAATGQEKYRKPYRPLTPAFLSVDYGDIGALERAITSKTCAIMLEPIQGEGGVYAASKEYMQDVRALCDKHDILLIFDEVQTGNGRTGTLFAYEHFDVEPDILTTAKGLGNGIPIGALLAKGHVAAAFEKGDHGTTFGGNPFACTAGVTVINELLNNGIMANCVSTGNYFKERLEQLQQKHSTKLKEVRGLGLLLGLELLPPLEAATINNELLQKGFVVGLAANNTLRFAPPLTISTQQVDSLLIAMDEVLTAQ
ncbi:aspartate aminotransferase family protein [Clostridia bacterium OttesenSCG-928-F22]|nr:aspartate aminotransferase family protein [Clostridia bacterium OttesenSCG-928-F22]